MDGLLHIRIAGRSYAVSALALIMAVIGLGYLGEVLLQGGLGDMSARGGLGSRLLGFGAIEMWPSWAAGADGPKAVFERGEWWRLFSSVFLHGSVLHLVMNGWALLQLGRVTEIIYGGVGLVIVFLVSGVAGSLASDAWYTLRGQPAISLGASGAICGLLGVLLAHMRSRTDAAAQHVGRSLMTWAIMILGMGIFIPRINNAAHIGGFVAGYLLARVLRPGHFLHMLRGWPRWRGPVIAMLLTTVAVVALGIAGLGARERLRDTTAAVMLSERIDNALRLLGSRRGGAASIGDARRAISAVDAGPVFRPAQQRALALLEGDGPRNPLATEELEQLRRKLLDEASERAPDMFITVPMR